MLGIRPRPSLRARPSLLDFLQRSNQLSRPSTPRPTSPTSLFAQIQYFDQALFTPLPDLDHFEHLEKSLAQLPEQYTQSTSPIRITMPAARNEIDESEDGHGSVYSVSGPVIVAEHMLGCAMYELVRSPLRCRGYRANSFRSVSDMISSSAKSFELKPIKLQSKSTRKLVCQA